MSEAAERVRSLPRIPMPTDAPAILEAVHAHKVIEQPRPVEIVRGTLWAGCVTVGAAESGVGKTFVALNLAGAVSDGTPWFGRATRQGSVAYFSYEGDALGLRLRALRDVGGCKLDHLYILRPSDTLSPRVDYDRIEHPSPGEQAAAAALDALSAEITENALPPIRLLVSDTVRASMSGSEDSSDSVSAYLRAVRRLMTHAPDAAGLLIHHAGWQDSDTRRKRERGSSAWRGNSDGTLYIDLGEEIPNGGARLIVRTLKVRDGEKPSPLYLIRRRVDIGEVDADGRPVTTCLIERDPRSRQEREAETQAATDAALRAQDLRVLRGISDKPETATSIRGIRAVVGLSYQVVSDAITRCIGHGWLNPAIVGSPTRSRSRDRPCSQRRPSHEAAPRAPSSTEGNSGAAPRNDTGHSL